MRTHITYLTHCGTVQVVLLKIHVVPILTNHAWFYHQLSSITEDDIEVRICKDLTSRYQDVLVNMLELYIQ